MSKFLVCSDSFKETLDAPGVCDAIEQGIRGADATAVVTKVPMSDGGDGFLLALRDPVGLTFHTVEVSGPKVGSLVQAKYGISAARDFAVIEMAEAVGLHLVPNKSERTPLEYTTFGVGQLIRHAYEVGRVRKVLLGIGGTSTLDGGLGLLQALGLRVKVGEVWITRPVMARDLFDLTDLAWCFEEAPCPDLTIDLACDVTNPFCGSEGAAYTYGPQKNATTEQIYRLDVAMEALVSLLHRHFGRNIRHLPGSGAAGGTAGSVHAVLGSRIASGSALFVEFVGLSKLVQEAEVIVTGEGCYDSQSEKGKVVGAVLSLCAFHRKPKVVVVCGRGGEGALLKAGGGSVHVTILSLSDLFPLDECMAQPSQCVRRMVTDRYRDMI